MSGLGCGGQCGEDVACTECGEPAYCLNDPPTWHPCPHDKPLCGRPICLATCMDCRAVMEADMAATGVYTEAADPLWQPPVETDAAYRERTHLHGFDTGTNSYAPRKDAS